MLTAAVWAAVGGGAGFLCIGCVEARLGRLLTAADFAPTRINWPHPRDTPRLADALARAPHPLGDVWTDYPHGRPTARGTNVVRRTPSRRTP